MVTTQEKINALSATIMHWKRIKKPDMWKLPTLYMVRKAALDALGWESPHPSHCFLCFVAYDGCISWWARCQNCPLLGSASPLKYRKNCPKGSCYAGHSYLFFAERAFETRDRKAFLRIVDAGIHQLQRLLTRYMIERENELYTENVRMAKENRK